MVSVEIDKSIQNFCCDEMFGKNEVCVYLHEKYKGKSCVEMDACPLYLWKKMGMVREEIVT
jgi:hypothetical protein